MEEHGKTLVGICDKIINIFFPMNIIIQNTINEYYKCINRDSSDLCLSDYNTLCRLYNNGYTDNIPDLFESGHELKIFDDFLNDVFTHDLKHIYESSSGFFNTGWSFYSTKCIDQNNHIKYTPFCKKNSNIGYPIYIEFVYDEISEMYASIKNRQIDPLDLTYENIIIVINMFYIDDIRLLKSSIKHELTHVVPSYIKQNFNNLNSKKNTIGYSVDHYNIFKRTFDISKPEYDMLCEMLYLLNDSEQDAFINGTLQYISYNDNKSIDEYINDSYVTNKIDRFEYCLDYLNTASDYFILILGYYMQFHHYISGNLKLQYVINYDSHSIKETRIDKKNAKEIKNYFSYYFEKYKKKLTNAISRTIK